MQLILVRHGISADNVGNIISGGKSNPDLSQKGIAEIKKVSEFIDPQKIDAVYSSPLSRAYETAEILINKQKKIHIDPRLVEINFGDWEGKKDSEFHEQYPDAFDYMGMFSTNYVKYDHNAESYDDLIARCRDFMNDLKEKEAGKTVMVVCHSFTIRGLLSGLLHLNIADIGSVKNVSFTEISFNEPDFWRPRLMSFNRELPAYFAKK